MAQRPPGTEPYRTAGAISRVTAFDDEILEGSVESRTADLFNAGRIIVVRPVSHRAEGTDKVTFGYPENDLFSIAAELTADTATGRPLLTYRLTAKTGGWYSVGSPVLRGEPRNEPTKSGSR